MSQLWLSYCEKNFLLKPQGHPVWNSFVCPTCDLCEKQYKQVWKTVFPKLICQKVACLSTLGQNMEHSIVVLFLTSDCIIHKINLGTNCSPLISELITKCYLILMSYSDIIIKIWWSVWSEKNAHISFVNIQMSVYKVYGTHKYWRRQCLWKGWESGTSEVNQATGVRWML